MELKTQQNAMLIQAESILQKADFYTQKHYINLCKNIQQFESACKDLGYSRTVVDDARFFLCAFLDEQYAWKKPLLTKFYESSTKDFFDRLEQRQSDPEKNIDLLELAYLCLSLGFRGKYSNTPSGNGIIAVIDTLYSDIRDVREDTTTSLVVGNKEKPKYFWGGPPIWITVFISLVILISIFISYNKTLNQYMAPAWNTLQILIKTNHKDNDH